MNASRTSTPSSRSGTPSYGYYPNESRTSEKDPDMASRLRALSENSRSTRSLGRSDANTSRPESGVGLKKKVGLISGISLIVGTMIGSGIFISPRGVAEGSGSVGLSLFSWLICGVIAILGGLCYAELGTMLPQSGAEHSYLLEAFGPLNKYVGPVPAFLFAWVNVVVLKPAQVAIISLAFAIYCTEPFYDVCNASTYAQKCLAVFIVILITVINCFSVKIATGIQNAFTVAKLAAIVVITFGGFVMMGLGNTEYLARGFAGTETSPGKVAIGLYNGMWAYDGWNNLNYVTEELVDPDKNLPRAILVAIPLVTICYLLVNISYFSVMSMPELLDSPATAVTWGHRVLGVMAWLIPVFVACSTFGATNGTIFSSGRLTYAAAREGHTLEILSMVHVKRYTPSPSIIVTCLIAIIFIIPGDIDSLIEIFNFAVWFFYGGTVLALIVMRWTHKDLHRPFKVPIVIPFIVLFVSLFLVIAPIVDNPRLELLYGFLFIISGLIFYIPFVYFEKHPPFMDGITTFMQCLLEVAPPAAAQS